MLFFRTSADDHWDGIRDILDQLLQYHFLFVKKYADVFVTLYQNNLIWMPEKKFNVILPKTMPVWSDNPIEQTYRSGYIVAGIEAIQRIWIERGCQESIEEMMRIIKKAFPCGEILTDVVK